MHHIEAYFPTRREAFNDAMLSKANGKSLRNVLVAEHIEEAVKEARALFKEWDIDITNRIIVVTCPDAICGRGGFTYDATYADVRISKRVWRIERAYRSYARNPLQNWRVMGGQFSRKSTEQELSRMRQLSKTGC